ncbi:MAG: hypothetical protein F6K03_06690, partial [Kamptonema sp. SIO4C4]|nr:hypothetical protein [Kamptonema sp. SIO4C4]
MEVREALEEIACVKGIEDEFNLILNRCCHILINRWQLQPNTRWAIPELVELFEYVPPLGTLKARGARRLRQLVRDFRETEQFLTLQRLARIIQNTIEEKGKLRPRIVERDSNLVGTLINRYPYLYEHCLLSQDSSYEHQQTVRYIRDQLQQQFELDLSQYVMYQVRTAQHKKIIKPKKQRIIQPVTNPTLLSDRELGFALRQFVGKPQGKYTHRESAQLFLSRS